MLKICIAAVQREVSLEQSDEVSHAHKESVSSSCISNGDYGREDRPNVTKYNDSNEHLPSRGRGREREAHIQIEW